MNEPLWNTTDLACAAALLVLKFNLMSIDKANPRRAIFIFERSDELIKTVNAFFADALTVNPRIYFDSVKKLKTMLYM